MIDFQEALVKMNCKCPFCFETFAHDKVAFRAMTAFVKQDFSDEMEEQERKIKERYQKAEDELYKNFWDNFPGSEINNEYSEYPVIDNNNPNALKGAYKYDASGFVNEVTDEFGRTSDVRICPYCHNNLPFEFGKYPVKYISVVGITSSGKTIYLSQLLKYLDSFFTKAGLTMFGTCDEIDKFLAGHKISKDKPLPRGTVPEALTPPMAANVKDNSTQKMYTLVFYDIAGENCVKPRRMKKFGPFIENSDGIILIIDPGQFMGEIQGADEEEQELYKPDKVIGAMCDAFVTSNNKNGQSNIPLAVTLSKGDTMKNVLNYSSNIFDNIDYSLYENGIFPYNDFRSTDIDVWHLMQELDNDKALILKNKLEQCFPCHLFFIVSSLNTEPYEAEDEDNKECYKIDEEPEAVRVEEPLLWVLDKIGIGTKTEKNNNPKKRKFPKLFHIM